MTELSKETQLSLYRRMVLVREFEEKLVELYPEQEMRCPVHLSIGQEGTAAGMCEALSKEDMVFGNHRSHGHYVAKGGSLRKIMAEMYGKVTGCAKGVGGSMHLIDLDVGIVAITPIVGGIIPVAAGAALANQMKKSTKMVTLFLGDAAVEEGVFHETLNFSALKKLPMIYFCENNLYSVYTHLDQRQPKRGIHEMVRGHGVTTYTCDGNDAIEVYRTAKQAYEDVKSGRGPVFIEASTYRWREHCGPNFDNDIGYRTENEFLDWKAKCPLMKMQRVLLEQKVAMQIELDKIREKVIIDIEDAVTFAKHSPFPPKEQLFENLYAE